MTNESFIKIMSELLNDENDIQTLCRQFTYDIDSDLYLYKDTALTKEQSTFLIDHLHFFSKKTCKGYILGCNTNKALLYIIDEYGLIEDRTAARLKLLLAEICEPCLTKLPNYNPDTCYEIYTNDNNNIKVSVYKSSNLNNKSLLNDLTNIFR